MSIKTGRPKGTLIGDSMSGRARAAGLRPGLVWHRINKLGWDDAKALGTPKRVRKGAV